MSPTVSTQRRLPVAPGGTAPPYLTLPPLDRVSASLTGWTRAHWLAVADQLLDSLTPWATSDGAQYRLPGRGSWSGVVLDGLEGFARPFLLAALRLAAPDSPAQLALRERYAQGLVAGTDPRGAHAWPTLTDCSQQIVEAASIALGLHLSRAQLWDTLREHEQEQIAQWLGGAVGARTWDNNWILFRSVIQEFLASIGAAHSRSEIEEGLDRLEQWYVGDGWYTDGDGRRFDYYNAFVLHAYPLLWTTMTSDDGGRAAVYRQRLRRYLEQYTQLFGRDGAPVLHGRSLTYRFGVLAPFWIGQLFEATPLSPGQTRRLASGVVRHFVERGAPDRHGLLSLGWHDLHLPTTQPYSGPASPYWASKGFFGLLIPPTDAVWAAPESPLPQDTEDTCVSLPVPGWIVQGTHDDGLVRLLNHGSDHNGPGESADDPHYSPFAFSNRSAPQVGPAPRWANQVAVLDLDGTPTSRGHIETLGTGAGMAASRYESTLSDGTPVRIDVASVVSGRFEIRVVLVEGAPGRPVVLGGYPLAGERIDVERVECDVAYATNSAGLTSWIRRVFGWDGLEVEQLSDSGPLGPVGVVPVLRAAREASRTLHVAIVSLTADRVPSSVPILDIDLDIDAKIDSKIDPDLAEGAVTIHLCGGERVKVLLGGDLSSTDRLSRHISEGPEHG